MLARRSALPLLFPLVLLPSLALADKTPPPVQGEYKILPPGTYKDIGKRTVSKSGNLIREGARYTRKIFDPSENHQAPIQPGEAAVCVSNFTSNLSYQMLVRNRKENADGTWTVTLEVTRATATVSLENVVWLPKGFAKAIDDHEEAHRQIAEIVYAQSLEPLDAAVLAVRGKSFSATAATAADAADQAKQKIFTTFNDRYHEILPAREDRLQKRFDALTAHGTNQKHPVEHHLNEVFRSEKK